MNRSPRNGRELPVPKCKRGHVLTPAHSYPYLRNGKPESKCRACESERRWSIAKTVARVRAGR